MEFERPVRYEEALAALRARALMPTRLRSRELEQLPAALRERAFFSSAVTRAEILQAAKDAVETLLASGADRATLRMQLRALIARTGYQPMPGTAGSLQDLLSEARLNLILDTNTAQVSGYARHKAEQSEVLRRLRPAKELIRVGRLPLHPRNWRQRWQDAGGRLVGGFRMVARTDDPIWVAISRFGTPYPPFDYNSGMRTRPIGRQEAERLGVIGPEEVPAAEEPGLNDDYSAAAGSLSDNLLEALKRTGVARQNAQGRWVPSA